MCACVHIPATFGYRFVYDVNTVRLNLRPATGIFKTEWDAMQTAHPRVVVSESSIDYHTISLVNSDLAKEVLLGMFQVHT